MEWRIHRKAETVSTNLDARAGRPGDVYLADFQTAGRGRLDHRWLSPPGANLMMSAVLSVEGLSPEAISTLPLVIGLAVSRGLSPWLGGLSPWLKWPNDVLVEGRKLAGILCERQGDAVIAGIGVNVGQVAFPQEIAERATSIALIARFRGACPQVGEVCRQILGEIEHWHEVWRKRGFAAVLPELEQHDYLKGRLVSIRQTDEDVVPIVGVCKGIQPDGSLDVGGTKVYAGEAHVEMS